MDFNKPINIHWFRRDLRLDDNAALFHSLKSGSSTLGIFIFDPNILNDLIETKGELQLDKRVVFIHQRLTLLKNELKQLGSDLLVLYKSPLDAWNEILSSYNVQTVYTNHDYEPYALLRDKEIETLLAQKGIAFHTYKDQCIFEKQEVVKDDGKPYTVFTPYSKKWKAKLNAFYLKSYPTEKYFDNLLKVDADFNIPTLEEMGFRDESIDFPPVESDDEILGKYGEQRDFPAVKGTSKLGIHLRFGTISIRKLASKAVQKGFETYLNELIWRDFYMMILANFPHVVHSSFRKEYDTIAWRNNEKEFEQWCQGKTGYPIVDAGMRELNATGYMHNRVRMIVASFLTKHLLIDWRKGEAYFAQKLLDFELASNNGGWQWAAGSGCDAAPYFRVFNPELQTQKFDPKGGYIRKWVKELNDFNYPRPIVEHSFARKRALETYGFALGKEKNM